jgi:predicted DNA-binding WGR domain protein
VTAVSAITRAQLQWPPTMRLFMQTKAAGAEAPRYYQIVLEQDLLGGWTLFREWGQQGSRASSRRELFLERDAAVLAFERARDAQLKRGFQVMFSQGFDGRRAN